MLDVHPRAECGGLEFRGSGTVIEADGAVAVVAGAVVPTRLTEDDQGRHNHQRGCHEREPSMQEYPLPPPMEKETHQSHT